MMNKTRKLFPTIMQSDLYYISTYVYIYCDQLSGVSMSSQSINKAVRFYVQTKNLRIFTIYDTGERKKGTSKKKPKYRYIYTKTKILKESKQYCIGRRKKWARYSNKTFRSPILQDFMIEKQKNSSTQCTDEKNNLSIDNLDIFHVTRDVLIYLNNRVY